MSNGMKQTEIGEIPVEWEVKKLKDVTTSFAGGTPKRNEGDYYNGDIPWVKSGEVNQRNITDTHEKITAKALKESAARLIVPNSILLALYGATAGNVGMLRVAACSNQAVLAINSRDKSLSNDFLFFYLKFTTLEVLKLTQGSGQPNLSKGIIDSIRIPLPPLSEQQKIAEVLSTVDEKMAVIDEQLAKTTELKTGLMQHLLTKGIGHTEFKDSPLGQIPRRWQVLPLNDVCDKVTDGEHLSPKTLLEGYPILSAKDIRENGVDFSGAKFLSEEAFYLSLKRCNPQLNDILIVSRGATIGRVTLNRTNKPFALMGSVILLKPNKNRILGSFLAFLLQRKEFKDSLFSLSGSSAQQAIYLKDIKKSNLLIPPVEEQIQIAELLTTIDEKVQVLRDKKTHYQTLKQGLMQQLLTGKLRVAQDAIPA